MDSELMNALVLTNGALSLRRLEVPVPGPDEVLLKVRFAGICGTDLALLQGYADFTGVPGHEFLAEVVAAGEDVQAPAVGQRVVCEINVSCGHCDLCLAGHPTHCRGRDVIGIRGRAGAFADYLVAPAANVFPVPDGVSDVQGTFVEPVAAALQIAEQVEFLPGMRVLVVGAGRLGQLIARVLSLHAVDLQVVARHERQRACLAQAGIATIDEGEVPSRAVDVAVDATGHASGVALAFDALRPRGTLVVKSTLSNALTLDATRLVVDELTVVGSRCGAFRHALDALETGQVDPSPLLDAVVPLADYEYAFAQARRRGALKVLLAPDERDTRDYRS